ncbi:LrgB family protein [Clostridium sp. 19966]|uniref:LrgB family protein n=1 Tax=Clostridium sp. 19966 TaxID=2768166 RepID=UPI0028E19BFB|nr:LrgB family protein [Clostridium sp. 19966]
MKDLLTSPMFGIIVSILAYEIGLFLNRKTKLPIFNPLLVGIIIVVLFLKLFKIDVEFYNIGGDYISMFLAPATVILAVPLYKQINVLKKNFLQIIVGITVGCLTSISTVYLSTQLLGMRHDVGRSLIPKSITTPVGMQVSKQIGGIPSITVAAIIITGIIGAIVAPIVCKVFKIHDGVARGIAIGTASHAVGTSKAMEMGEIEGAMSGLSIGIAALMTVIITTVLFK